ncbi:MAG: hypothetical protein KDK28_17945 [Maritimibacter sp.]|nr:hypothetical protein [Maritimibacter sp.]
MSDVQSSTKNGGAHPGLRELWIEHLEHRGSDIPTADDFKTFGGLAQLEQLQTILRDTDPDQLGTIRPALREARTAKWQRAREMAGNPPKKQTGPVPKLSISEEALPRAWRRDIADMRRLRSIEDDGLLDLDERTPPAAAVIKTMVGGLRILAGSCVKRGMPVELTKSTVTAWREDCHNRGNRNVSIASRLKDFLVFARWRDEDEELIAHLADMKRRYLRAAKGQMKRKDRWIIDNPINIGDVWVKAEDLLSEASSAQLGTATHANLVFDAACIALSVVCPLRCRDLHRIRFGTHLRRDADGWSLRIETSKTGLHYDRPHLWPELTPFLDALVVLDTPTGELWAAYDAKDGTPIFSRDFGVSEPYRYWPSRCWRRHFNVGEHIVRSLWHSMLFESETDDQWIALALCGQGIGRTGQEYLLEGAKKRASRRARRKIREHRERIGSDAQDVVAGGKRDPSRLQAPQHAGSRGWSSTPSP